MPDQLDDLFNEAIATAKKGARAESAPNVDAEYVRDSVHMKEMITEVLDAAKAPERDIAKWKEAGHRIVGLWEEPLVIEGYLSREHPCDVRVFRNSIRTLIDKTKLGTAIYGLATKQVTGRWELAGYRIVDDSLVRSDQRVAVQRMEGTTDEIVAAEVMADRIDDFRPRNLRTIRIWLAWIDSAGAEALVYDVHGKPKDAPTVVVNNGGGHTVERVIVVQQGQTPGVDDLLALAQGKADIQTEGVDNKPLHWKQRQRLKELEEAEAARKGGG